MTCGSTLDPEIERADVCLERWHGRGDRMRLNTKRLGEKRLQNVWVSERKFAGSNGDPTFRQLVGFDPSLSLAEELAQIKTGPADATDYAWREYCDAFA